MHIFAYSNNNHCIDACISCKFLVHTSLGTNSSQPFSLSIKLFKSIYVINITTSCRYYVNIIIHKLYCNIFFMVYATVF